jgi:RNA polymerase primary sigma factor
MLSIEKRNKIVEDNIRLVYHFAKRYAGVPGAEYEDLVQEGVIGLIDAVERHKPGRAKLSTYSWYAINSHMLNFIDDTRRTVRIPRATCDLVRRVKKAEKLLIGELGRKPNDYEFVNRLEMPIQKIRKLKKFSCRNVSFEDGVTFRTMNPEKMHSFRYLEDEENLATIEEYDPAIKNFLCDESAKTPEEILKGYLGKALLLRKTLAVLRTLSPREEQIIAMRFGISKTEEEMAYNEISELYELSHQRIRQIEARALRKLRHPSRSSLLKPFLGSGAFQNWSWDYKPPKDEGFDFHSCTGLSLHLNGDFDHLNSPCEDCWKFIKFYKIEKHFKENPHDRINKNRPPLRRVAPA